MTLMLTLLWCDRQQDILTAPVLCRICLHVAKLNNDDVNTLTIHDTTHAWLQSNV